MRVAFLAMAMFLIGLVGGKFAVDSQPPVVKGDGSVVVTLQSGTVIKNKNDKQQDGSESGAKAATGGAGGKDAGKSVAAIFKETVEKAVIKEKQQDGKKVHNKTIVGGAGENGLVEKTEIVVKKLGEGVLKKKQQNGNDFNSEAAAEGASGNNLLGKVGIVKNLEEGVLKGKTGGGFGAFSDNNELLKVIVPDLIKALSDLKAEIQVFTSLTLSSYVKEKLLAHVDELIKKLQKSGLDEGTKPCDVIKELIEEIEDDIFGEISEGDKKSLLEKIKKILGPYKQKYMVALGSKKTDFLNNLADRVIQKVREAFQDKELLFLTTPMKEHIIANFIKLNEERQGKGKFTDFKEVQENLVNDLTTNFAGQITQENARSAVKHISEIIKAFLKQAFGGKDGHGNLDLDKIAEGFLKALTVILDTVEFKDLTAQEKEFIIKFFEEQNNERKKTGKFSDRKELFSNLVKRLTAEYPDKFTEKRAQTIVKQIGAKVKEVLKQKFGGKDGLGHPGSGKFKFPNLLELIGGALSQGKFGILNEVQTKAVRELIKKVTEQHKTKQGTSGHVSRKDALNKELAELEAAGTITSEISAKIKAFLNGIAKQAGGFLAKFLESIKEFLSPIFYNLKTIVDGVEIKIKVKTLLHETGFLHFAFSSKGPSPATVVTKEHVVVFGFKSCFVLKKYTDLIKYANGCKEKNGTSFENATVIQYDGNITCSEEEGNKFLDSNPLIKKVCGEKKLVCLKEIARPIDGRNLLKAITFGNIYSINVLHFPKFPPQPNGQGGHGGHQSSGGAFLGLGQPAGHGGQQGGQYHSGGGFLGLGQPVGHGGQQGGQYQSGGGGSGLELGLDIGIGGRSSSRAEREAVQNDNEDDDNAEDNEDVDVDVNDDDDDDDNAY